MSPFYSPLKYIALLFVLLALHAANPLLATAHQPIEGSSPQLPDGVSAVDWQQIQQQMQYGIAPLVGSPDTYMTNAGQWQVRFDPSGVTMSEGANERMGEWVKFTLADSSSRNLTNSRPRLFADSPTRLTYYHDANLQERYDNRAAGLKQTFILQKRSKEYGVRSKLLPAPYSLLPTPFSFLRLQLHLSGSLTPRLADDQTLLLQDEHRQTQLTYAGLYVYDARGKTMPSHFELTGTILTIVVDDAQAVYPLTIDPTVIQQALIKGGSLIGSDGLGTHIALSGDTLVVGTQPNVISRIYVFVRSSGTWSQQAMLVGSNVAGFPNSHFPADIDIDGNTIVASDKFDDGTATDSGAAYVFVRSGTTWSQQAYLKASNPDAGDEFGTSVGISGNTIVVGAVGESSNATWVDGDESDNSASLAGAAYVFVRSGTTWSQQAYLKASNAEAYDTFGRAVDISGNTIVVGADWERSSATGVNGDEADNSMGDAGAAYVFVRSGGCCWSQQAYLKASNTSGMDYFGSAVAIDVNTIVVGAWGEDSNATLVNGNQSNDSAIDSGAVYVFFRSGSSWSQQAYLKATNTGAGDMLTRGDSNSGYALDISGDTIIAGAAQESSNATGIDGNGANNSAAYSGAAYLFARTGTTWARKAYVKASNTATNNFFGTSVAVDSSSATAAVGAPWENTTVSHSGATYAFIFAGLICGTVSGNTSEAGASATFTVKLSSPPTANVVINVASGDTTEGTVSPSSLTFTTADWNIAQTVTVTGANDFIVDGAQAYVVNLTVNTASTLDPNYDTITPVAVSVINNDDGDTAGYTVTPTSGLVTTEAGGIATFTVRLTSQPLANVVVNVVSNDLTEGTVSPSSLTLTAANWNIPQTVTVTGVDDFVADGNIAYVARLTLGSTTDTTGYASLNPPDPSVTNTNDDVVGFTVSPTVITTTEAGGSATFGVRLTSQPTNKVVVNVVSGNTAENTVSVGSLTFITSTWNVTQTVTVTGVNEFIDDGDQVTNIALSINAGLTLDTSGYAAQNPPDVTVTNVDNDAVGFTVSAVSGNTTETGGTASFTVKLSSQPIGNVKIDVSSGNTAEGTTSPSFLSFTGLTWNTPQTVTMTGVDELIDDGNQVYTAVLAINMGGTTDSTGYATLTPTEVNVTNINNDTAGYTVSAISGNISETGTSATFNLRLNSEPTSDVTITVTSGDISEGTVSPTSLTFTAGDWTVPQTVIVTGVNDFIQDGNITYPVNLSSSSADANYNGTAIPSVNVINGDSDDIVGVIVFPTSGHTTTEAGASATFTITLNSEPTADVVIDVTSNDTTEGVASPAPLTFTNLNWNIPQTVTVTGVDDAIDDESVSYTVFVAMNTASTLDPLYDPLNPNDVSVINDDDADTWGIVVSPISGHTNENGVAATFGVILQSEPVAVVTIPMTSSDLTEGVVSETLLTFDATNWNITQTVTVTGVDDVLYDPTINYVIRLGPSSSGDANYNGVLLPDVAVTNDSNDSGSPLGLPIAITTSEDISYTFKVANFHYSDPYNQPMSGVKILLQPQNGRLTYRGAAVVSMGIYTDVTQLVYWPAPNTSGSYPNPFYYANVNVLGLVSQFYAVSITVTPLNDVPTSQDNVMIVGESLSYTLSTLDIAVNDPDNNGSDLMQVVTLPSKGQLSCNGVSATIGQECVISQVTYSPVMSQTGNPYTQFQFKVKDLTDLYSAAAYTLTVTVQPLLGAPTSANSQVTLAEDTTYLFKVGDFPFTDPDADAFNGVKLVRLPLKGTLSCNNSSLTVGSDCAEVTQLVYQPISDTFGTPYSDFQFKVKDGDGLYSVANYTMTLNVTNLPDAPTSQPLTLTLAQDTAYSFNANNVSFVDIDGDNFTGLQFVDGSPLADLKCDGVDMTLGATCEVSKVVFMPPDEAIGSPYLTATFKVQDSRGQLSDEVYPLTINLIQTRFFPTGEDSEVTLQEDTPYTFTAATIPFSHTNSAQSLAAILFLDLPGFQNLAGLKCQGATVMTGTTCDPAKLVFYPTVNQFGTPYSRLSYQLQDSSGEMSRQAYSLTLNVTPMPDPPTSTNVSVTMAEDTGYRFDAASFPFSDVDGDTMQGWQIVTLPMSGTLSCGGVDMSQTSQVLKTCEVSQLLTYRPVTDTYGSPYAQLTYRVIDSTGLTSTELYTAIVDVTSAGDPPRGGESSLTVMANETYPLTVSDFSFSDPDDDTFAGLKLMLLPTRGELRCNGAALFLGQNCSINNLSYTPEPNSFGVNYANFGFRVQDSSGQFSLDSYTMTLNVTAVETLPQGGAALLALVSGQTYAFKVTDFPYQNGNGQPLMGLSLVSLPTTGQIKCNGQPMTVQQSCAITQLTFTLPLTTPSGLYPLFSFKLQAADLALSTSSYLASAQVSATASNIMVNNNIVTATEDVAYIFQASDFVLQNATEQVASIYLMSAPAQGQLRCGGVPLLMGQSCSLSQALTFLSALDDFGVDYARFSFKVRTNKGNLSSNVAEIQINVTGVPDSPQLATPPLEQAVLGELYNYTIIGVAPDGGTLTVNVDGLPSWLTPIYDSFGNITLVGVPTTTQVMPPIVITLVDGAGNSYTQTFDLNVTPVNRPPFFISAPLNYALYGQPYNYPTKATDPDGVETLTMRAVSKPDWLSWQDNGNGQAVLSGTTTIAGDYPIVLEVRDGVGVTSQQSFTLTVLNNAPVAVLDKAVIARKDETLLLSVVANDFDRDGNPLQIVSVGTPQKGTVTISGTQLFYEPNFTELTGLDTFAYTISDGDKTATAMVEIELQLNDPPILKPDSLELVAGNAYPIIVPPLDNDYDPNLHGLVLLGLAAGPTDIPAALNTRGNMARDRYGKTAIYLPPVANMGEATAWHETYYYTATDQTENPKMVSSTINITLLNPNKITVDLQLTRRTEVTKLYAYETQEAVSYLEVVNPTNYPAANVVLTETLSGVGLKVLNSVGLSNWGFCQINVQKVFVCNIGQLAAGQRVMVTTTHTLQAEPGTLIITSTLASQTRDLTLTNNLRVSQIKVPNKREARPVGQYTVTADRFNELGDGRYRASGFVKIGSYFQLLGVNDWLEFNETNVTAMQGTLGTVQGQLSLYRGDFTANSKGQGQFATNGTYLLQQVGGFTATQVKLLTLDLLKGYVSGEATLPLSSPGITLNTTLSFTMGPDLSFSGQAKQTAELLYGTNGNFKLTGLSLSLLKITKLSYGLQSKTAVLSFQGTTSNITNFTLKPDLTFNGVADKLSFNLNNEASLVFLKAKVDNKGLSSSNTNLNYLNITTNLSQKVTLSNDGKLSLVDQPILLAKTIQGKVFWLNRASIVIQQVNNNYVIKFKEVDLVLVMPQNNRTIPGFKLDGTANADIILKAGSARVKLIAPYFKDNKLMADKVEWQLPLLFGGGRYRYNKTVSLGNDDDPLAFMNTLPFPTDLKFGSLLTLSGLTGSITQVGKEFEVGFDGNLSGFDLPGVNTLKIRLSLDAAGRIRGSVPEIAFKLVGFEAKAKNMSISATMNQPGIINFEVEEAGIEEKSLNIKAGLYGLRIEKTYFLLPENWKLPSVNLKAPSLPTIPTIDFKLSTFGLKLPDLTLGTLRINIPDLKVKLGKLDLSLHLKLADFNLKLGDIRLGQIPAWDLPALKLKLEGLGLDLTGVDLPNMTLGELSLRLNGINLSLGSLNLKLGKFDLGSLDVNLGTFKIRDLGLTLPNLGLSLADIELDLPNMDLPNMTLGDFNLKLIRLGFGLPDVNITLGTIKLDSFNIFGDFKLIDLGLKLPDLGLTMPTIPDLSVNFPSFDADLELPDFKLPDIPQVDLNTVLPKIFLRGAYVDIPDFKIGGFHIGSFKATLIEKTKDKRDYVLDGIAKLNFSDIPGSSGCQFESQVRIAVDPILGRQVVEVTPLTDKPMDLIITPTNSTQAYTLPTLVTPEQYHQPLYVGQQGRDPRGIQVEKLTIDMGGANCSGIHLGYGVYLSKLNGSFTLVDGSSTLKLHLRVEWPSKALTGLDILAMEADMDMKIPVQRCTLRSYMQFRDDLVLGTPIKVFDGMSERNCQAQKTVQSVDQLDPAKAKELPFMVKAVAYLTLKQQVRNRDAIWVFKNVYLRHNTFCTAPNWNVSGPGYYYDAYKLDQCQAYYRYFAPQFNQKYLSTPNWYTGMFAQWIADTEFAGGGGSCYGRQCTFGRPIDRLYQSECQIYPNSNYCKQVPIKTLIGGPAYFYEDTLKWFDNLTPAEVSAAMRSIGLQAIGVVGEHYKEPFLLTMSGTPSVFGSTLGSANITMKADKAKGSFRYQKEFSPMKVKMGADFATWWGNGDFGFTAKGDMDLRVSLAFIDRILDDIGMDFHIKYELGKFNKPDGGTTWGIKGTFTFEIDLWLFSLSFDVAFYIDIDGNVAVGGNVDDYKLVDADAVRRAKQVQEARQRGKTDVGDQVKFLDPDPDLTFLPAGRDKDGRQSQDVVVNVNVANQQPAMIYLGSQGNGPTMEVIGPNGQVLDPNNLPSGITYTQETKFISGLGVSAAAGQGLGQLRVVNGAEMAGALDVLVNDKLAFSQVPFANTALYRSYPPGSYTVKFVATGTTSPVLAQTTVNLAPRVDFTVVASPKAAGSSELVAWPMQDDNSPRGNGNSAYLRFIHAGTGLPKLTLSQVMGHTYFKEIAYQRFGDYYKLFPMDYLFNLSDGQKTLLETAKIPLAPKGIYSMFVFNSKDGARVVIYQDAAETARLQLVNTTGQPLTVNIDQLPYQPLVTSTNLYFAPGGHQVKLDNNSQTVTLTSDQNNSLLAYLKAGQLQTLALADESPNNMGAANLRLVHVAESQPNVTLQLQSVETGHALSLPDVSFEQTTPFTMVDATTKTPYTLTLLNATNGQPIATQRVHLDEATNYTLYVYRVNGQWAIGLQENIHLTKKIQTFYGIAGDKAGRYQVRLKGDTLNTEYDLQVKGNKPKPVFSEVHVDTSDTAAPQLQWHLDSAHEPKTSVRVYAQNSPIVQTAVVTNNDGTTEPITQTVYDGVDISGALTSTASSWVDGSLQNYPFDLTKLVDGTYYLYVEADDGVNQRVRLSAPEPLVVKHEWPTTWNANLQLSQAGYRAITATWQSFPNPNGKYTYLVWQEAGEITTQTVRLTRDVLTQTIGGLKVGQTYQVWVEGFDYQNDRISPSEVVSITVPGPVFSLTLHSDLQGSENLADLQLPAGESLALEVTLSSPMQPYPTLISLAALPSSQLTVLIDPADELVPPADGLKSFVVVSAYPTVPSGVYTLTLIAASDGVTQALDIPINIMGPTFELVGSTEQLTLTNDSAVTMTVAISRTNGHYDPVNLTVMDAPPMSELNWEFDNNRLMLGETATLTLQDWPTVVGGVYSFTIAATDGNEQRFLTPTLILSKPDYSVTTTQEVVTATPGETTVLTVPFHLAFISGWNSEVKLWFDDSMVPPYSQMGLSTVPAATRELAGLGELEPMVTMSNEGVAELLITITPDTPMGRYLLPLTAWSNGRQLDLAVELMVGYSEDKGGKIYLPLLMQQGQTASQSGKVYLPLLLKQGIKPSN